MDFFGDGNFMRSDFTKRCHCRIGTYSESYRVSGFDWIAIFAESLALSVQSGFLRRRCLRCDYNNRIVWYNYCTSIMYVYEEVALFVKRYFALLWTDSEYRIVWNIKFYRLLDSDWRILRKFCIRLFIRMWSIYTYVILERTQVVYT